MEGFKQKMNSIKRGLKEFHTKKPHIEFFAALLTVPVLITVLLLNVNNLKGNSDKKESESNKTQTIVVTQPSTEKEKEVVVTKEVCKPGIGDITIASPDENDSMNDNPVNVDINYEANGYCNVVWSYRVNGGAWSSYDDRSIALYNLSNGNIKLDLRVKSVVNSDEQNLTRNFAYNGNTLDPTTTPSLTPAPTH